MLIGDNRDGAALTVGLATGGPHLESPSLPAPLALVDGGSMADRQGSNIQSELDYWCPIPFIDLSTPESLERDFYAWLKGEEDDSQREPSSNAHTQDLHRLPPIDHFIEGPHVPIAATGTALHHHHPGKFDTGMKRERNSISSSVRSSTCSYSPDAVASLHSSSPTTNAPPLGIVDEHTIAAPNPATTRMLVESMVANSGVGKASRSSGTNQLGRTYSPGLPLSMEERERIVELYKVGWKICDISKTLCITHSCVSKILHRFRTTGTVKPKDAKEGRQESPLVIAIRDYQQRLGIVRQSEIREQLIKDGVCRKENAPSRSSINHILRTKLDLKRRKK